MKNTAKKIKRSRELLGENLREFGTRFGVKECTVFGWESGKSRPRNDDVFDFIDLVTKDREFSRCFNKYQGKLAQYKDLSIIKD